MQIVTDKRQSNCKQFTILSRIDKERREVYNKKRHKLKIKTASFMMRFLQKTIFDISYNQHNPSKYHIVTRCDVSKTSPANAGDVLPFVLLFSKGPIRGLH